MRAAGGRPALHLPISSRMSWRTSALALRSWNEVYGYAVALGPVADGLAVDGDHGGDEGPAVAERDRLVDDRD